MSKKVKIIGCVAVLVVGLAGSVLGVKAVRAKKSAKKTISAEADASTTEWTEEEKKVQQQIEEIYDLDSQQQIADSLEEKKNSGEYTEDHILVEYNPFGTNTQSLYLYFCTDNAVSVQYTIHVDRSDISDFTQTAYQSETYQTEHELQIIGLIPDETNEITLELTDIDGNVEKRMISYDMPSLLGKEEVVLDSEIKNAEKLENGLYVVMGNDSATLDFMYYYDNQGVLRSEIPIIGYRSHRLLFDEQGMYYSISESRIARVNRLGQVTDLYNLGNYNLHHDYVFDDDGNLLVLATDTEGDAVEDRVIKVDVTSGVVTQVLDMGDLLPEFKAERVAEYDPETQESANREDEGLDWVHINTIQWLGDGRIVLSSRETSTIFEISDLYSEPKIQYMIGDETFWKGTAYEDLLLNKEGDFTIQGGQHSVTYEEDESLGDGQYYLYMFNNNIGISTSNPTFDWSSVGLTENTAKAGETSYYYKYLIDENAGTFSLVDSFSVPYSGYVSSAQDLNENYVIDSGFAGIFAEYDADHNLVASYTMDAEKFIYRVYKYSFDGYYFE